MPDVTFRDPFMIIEVEDLAASLRFYCDLLGFQPSYQFPAEGDAVFAVVQLDTVGLGLSQRTSESAVVGGPIANGQPFEICIYTSDADAAAVLLAGHGATQLLPPTDQPWGERLTYFEDPDGYRLHITAPMS